MTLTKHCFRQFLILALEFIGLALLVMWIRPGVANMHGELAQQAFAILIDIGVLGMLATIGSKAAELFDLSGFAGMVLFGFIAGPALFGILSADSVGLALAQVAGVLFILFEAGLHFDVTLLQKHIKTATLVALTGVLVPLGVFTFAGMYFFDLSPVAAILLGGIFSGTSVGLIIESLRRHHCITPATRNELIGAAVIEDVLAVLVLTFAVQMVNGSATISHSIAFLSAVTIFIVGTIVLWHFGFARRIARHLDQYHDHSVEPAYTRFFFGMMIVGSALAVLAGLEAILGAFGTGVVLSKIDDEIIQDAWKKIEGYMHIFAGGFFVSIGAMIPVEAVQTWSVWVTAVVLAVLAFVSKYVVAIWYTNKKKQRLFGYAFTIRGEIGLVFITIVAATGALSDRLLSASILAVILVTLVGGYFLEKEDSVC